MNGLGKGIMERAALPFWPAAWRRFKRLALCLCLSVLGASQAIADGIADFPQNNAVDASEQKIQFDIPKQSTFTALEFFATQSHIQVLFKTSAAQSHLSPGVRGLQTARDALQQLLNGTGLNATFVGARSVAVSYVSNSAQSPEAMASPGMGTVSLSLPTLRVQAPAENILLYEAYAHVVQARIRSVLSPGVVERLRGDGIKLMVWVDSQGVVQQSAIALSSGSNRIDQEVMSCVRGLSVQEDPPTGFPQPLHIHILSRS